MLWRAVDLTERLCALVFLIALFPLLLVLGLIVRVLSGRSPLVAHFRVGAHGESFWMLKFRTMWRRKEPPAGHPFTLVEYVADNGVPPRKTRDDSRVTSRFARFCRRYSLDELPQLLHVIGGRMSLVGPRPLIRSELEAYYGDRAAEVLTVKPGVTGLWQVMGRNNLDYRRRRRLDLFFVRQRSLRLYLMILARTVPVVLTGKDSW
jgi:exopolysaccharide production protein ExoY